MKKPDTKKRGKFKLDNYIKIFSPISLYVIPHHFLLLMLDLADMTEMSFDWLPATHCRHRWIQ